MQAKLTFTAGIGFDKYGHLVAELPVAIMTIRALVAQAFGGYTELATMGGWVNSSGELVQEPGRQWCALTIADSLEALHEKARHIAEQIAIALNQESVMLEIEQTSFTFIDQPVTINAPKAEEIHHG